MAKILVFAGSVRKGSLNKKLAKYAVSLLQPLEAEARFIDLADYDMPLYNGDLEEEIGKPEKARELKKLFIEYDGFVMACPEYNSSLAPLLKNSLDWISRDDEDDPYSLVAFKGKTACLLSASPGALGGLRGLVTMRSMLSNIGVIVLPQQVSISQADKAFDPEGKPSEERYRKSIETAMKEMVRVTRLVRMSNP